MPLAPPIPYRHKPGAQSRIVLDDDVEALIMRQRTGKKATAIRPPAAKASALSKSIKNEFKRTRVVGHIDGDTAFVPLSQGNINHHHIYLRTILSFFPEDTVGGSTDLEFGVPIMVSVDGQGEVETDIAGPLKREHGKSSHLFFRQLRGSVLRPFFQSYDAAEGDEAVFRRTAPRRFSLSLRKIAQGKRV